MADIIFEIVNAGDLIRMEPIKVYDGRWLSTKVTVKGGAFSGLFTADFMTRDFDLLKRDLKNLTLDFTGTAMFEPLEGQLILNIAGDGLGHFEVKCTARDHPVYGGALSFSMSFDQTDLSRLIAALDSITKAFP